MFSIKKSVHMHSKLKVKVTKSWVSERSFSNKKKKKEKKNGLNPLINISHTYFIQFLGGGNLLSLDLGPKGVSNLQSSLDPNFCYGQK